MNDKNDTVTEQNHESTIEPTLELEVRRSRKVRTGVKAGLSIRTTSGRGPVTDR